MFIHMQRLYQIGFNIKLCICQFTLPADLHISVERVFNMIIIFLFLHHSIMLCESEVLTYQGIGSVHIKSTKKGQCWTAPPQILIEFCTPINL